MNKKNILFFVLFLNFVFLFAQDKKYLSNLIDQLFYSDSIAYKLFDFNSNSINYDQGSLFKVSEADSCSLFFSIKGNGFMKIKSVDSGIECYTRAGYILLDENNNIMLMPGFELFHNDSKKDIEKIDISRKGILKILYSDKQIEEQKIQLYMPSSESEITCYGNRYCFSKVQEVNEDYEFYQGFLEMANVDKITILLEIQSILLNLVKNNEINQFVYEYDLMLCKELFYIYSESVKEEFLISFSEQTIDNSKLMYAREILKKFVLE